MDKKFDQGVGPTWRPSRRLHCYDDDDWWPFRNNSNSNKFK